MWFMYLWCYYSYIHSLSLAATEIMNTLNKEMLMVRRAGGPGQGAGGVELGGQLCRRMTLVAR